MRATGAEQTFGAVSSEAEKRAEPAFGRLVAAA